MLPHRLSQLSTRMHPKHFALSVVVEWIDAKMDGEIWLPILNRDSHVQVGGSGGGRCGEGGGVNYLASNFSNHYLRDHLSLQNQNQSKCLSQL